jgi:1-acyl-sn-glycerol-3-phosphate acyltransferase
MTDPGPVEGHATDDLPRRGPTVRPEALATARGSAPLEGLDWLGRDPDGHLGLLARLLIGVADLVVGLAAIRITIEGREHLPATGGYLVAAAVHRAWIDPLVAIRALPREPRPWFIGSGPSTFQSRWREALLRHIGGILPVWRGGADADVHVRASRAVVEAGCPFVIFIEGATAGAPDRVHRVRAGVGLLAVRLVDVPIVGLALAGSDDLYRGKRIAVRLLPPLTARELAGGDWPEMPPTANTRDELRLARLVTDRLAERLQSTVAELYPPTVDLPDRPRRWRWLRGLF